MLVVGRAMLAAGILIVRKQIKKKNYKASINKRIVVVSVCKYRFPVTGFKGLFISHHCTMINIYFGILNYLEFWPKRPDYG